MEVILGRSASYVGIFFRSTGFGSLTSSSTVRCLCLCDPTRWNIALQESRSQNRSLSSHLYQPQSKTFSLLNNKNVSLMCNDRVFRTFFNQTVRKQNERQSDEPKKMNIFQKMKQLTRDYWHILIPVHLATSAVWVAIFYTAAKNGVDIISVMEYVHMPEKYIDMIKNSKAGDLAVTYALYKIFTPIRYTVTVGGTTMSIRYLDRMGYLKFGRPAAAGATPTNKPTNGTKEKTDANRSECSKQSSERKN